MNYHSYGNETQSKTVRVLIVEDDSLVASYISDVLIEAGFVVAGIASSGQEAFGLVDADTELALVDICLAGPMDGIEVAHRLQEHHGVSVIFLSGTIDPSVIARAASVGAQGFLAKPFLPSQVYKALDAALGTRRREQTELEVKIDA